MNKLKTYNNFRYEYLIESVNNIDTELLLEGININKYQFATKKLMSEIGFNIYNVGTFGVSITALYPIIQNLMTTGKFVIPNTIENVVLLTICAVTVLVKENKEKAKKLIDYAFSKGVTQKDLDTVINIITTTKGLFSEIAQNFGKVISTFSEMLSYTALLVPFSMVLNNLILNGTITSELLSQSLPAIIVSIGAMGFKLLLNRIMHKLEIVIQGTDKFRNKENIKPLLVNDELKSPELKPVKVKIENFKQFESVRDLMKPKSEEEIEKSLKKLNPTEILKLSCINGYLEGVKYAISKGVDINT